MRLISWLLVACAVAAVALVDANTPEATTADPTTTDAATTASTTTAASVDDASTASGATETTVTAASTASPPSEPTEPSKATDETLPTEPTEAPVDEETEATEDPANTGATKKPVDKTTPKAGPTTTKGPTTTTEPRPDVEDFTVTCSKATSKCTYTLQVPGLDIDTFNGLLADTSSIESAVTGYAANDLVGLQAGVTKVFGDAQATADYVQDQLDIITAEIKVLDAQVIAMGNAFNDFNTSLQTAKANYNKISAKAGSCLSRQCILKETTTTRPATTTTVKTTPPPYCKTHPDACTPANGGKCENWYDSFQCTCKGNLDAEENECAMSACDVFKTAQLPGLVWSPGYNGTGNAEGYEGCDDGASWVITANNTKTNVLGLADGTSTKVDGIKGLVSADASLQITVLKYKLKVTSKTKIAQITQILAYGPTATIAYSGSADDYFFFDFVEIPDPTKS